MSDWADEKADRIMDACWDRDTNIQACLAEAFRQHRAEVLEEAARVVDNASRVRNKDERERIYKIAAALRSYIKKDPA